MYDNSPSKFVAKQARPNFLENKFNVPDKVSDTFFPEIFRVLRQKIVNFHQLKNFNNSFLRLYFDYNVEGFN
jgi:hypothetical protein